MKLRLITVIFFLAFFSGRSVGQSRSQTYFEVKIYHFQTAEQEMMIDEYLKAAYIPALHRNKIKHVGVFKPIGNDTLQDKRVYLLVPFKSPQQYAGLHDFLMKDKQHNADGQAYLEASYQRPPYNRMESIFIKAFADMPWLQLPGLSNELSKRVYELRSYEGPTEKLYEKKVEMFNQGGEIALFEKLDFNAIFYGSVIAGNRIPNMMYMTSFEDMASRDAHWKAFSASPDWKSLSAQEYYKNTVSKSETILLHPVSYSDF